MSRLLDRFGEWYLGQQVVTRGKDAVGRRLRPHLGLLRATTRTGAVMEVEPADLIQYSVLLTGQWEPAETAALLDELRAGDVVYDIGANVGYFTLLAAQAVGPSGHVYSFEPNPPTLARLRRNVELNSLANVTVLPLALGDRDEEITFHAVGGANSGASSLRDGLVGSSSTTVRLARLDDLRGEHVVRSPDVVKMDVEGAEYLALRGMPSTLAEPGWRSLIIEISDRFLRELGGDEASLLELLDAAGFSTTRELSRHTKVEPDGRPFQYTSLFRRS